MTPDFNYRDTIDKRSRCLDLEIRSDSSFHIEGNSSANQSTIPGWNVNEEYNGKWELNNNKLTLWLEPKEDKMLLAFIIIKLTKEKLVLRSSFNKHNSKHDIKYLRL